MRKLYVSMPRRYAYLNAKIRALISKMLSAGDYEKILQTDTFEESVRLLSTTSTGSELAELLTKAKVDLVEVDQALTSVFVKAFRLISGYAPSKARQFLETYLRKIDIDGLKTCIRAVHNRMRKDEALKFVISTSAKTRDELGRLLEAQSVAQLVEEVRDKSLKEALEKALPLYESTGSTVPLESSLDKVLYSLLWDQIKKKLNRIDRAHAEELVGYRIDLSNMLVALRCKQLGLGPAALELLIMPTYYRLRLNLDEVAKVRNVSELLNVFAATAYKEIVQQARESFEKESDITQIESLADRYIAHQSFREFIGYSFHIGIALAYLNLKFYELRNIKAVIVGKYENIPIQKIRNVLTFF
nr:V-type ATPase subunit [Candidatus Njordarchaeum guaymaensis]